jgi:hypothetical protein
VLEEVRVLLQPNAGGVVAELDKLNVYGPGGFFKPHYDTPRSEGKLLWARAAVCHCWYSSVKRRIDNMVQDYQNKACSVSSIHTHAPLQ